MTKKQRLDSASDNDELQALFDSIAGAAVESKPAVVAAPKAGASEGDDDELQALFDAVAAEFDGGEAAAEIDIEAADASSGEEVVAENVFTRIGQMTRQVHDTLRVLGCDGVLREAVEAIPDARQRLNYITQMTEQAASRVLNATDIAKPIQDKVHADAQSLQRRWDQLFANRLSTEEFKVLAGDTRGFLGEVERSSAATNQQLLEIMMAQDFQDLTGQVIKKVVDLAQALETELLQVLLEVTPPEKRAAQKPEGLLNGPVVNAAGREDVVSTQEQVDELLDSLGF